MKPRFIRSRLLAIVGCCLAASSVEANVFYQSATLGPTGQSSGLTIGGQYLGARFQVTQTVVVDGIGGHMFDLTFPYNGPIFGAIISLSGPSALPSGSPFNPGTVIATTTFTPPDEFDPGSQDILVPLSATLAPGNYGLVFGSGQFGATGTGGMTDNNPTLPGASFFYWDSSSHVWKNIDPSANGMRFAVSVIPEPRPTSLFLALLCVGLAVRRRLGIHDVA